MAQINWQKVGPIAQIAVNQRFPDVDEAMQNFDLKHREIRCVSYIRSYAPSIMLIFEFQPPEDGRRATTVVQSSIDGQQRLVSSSPTEDEIAAVADFVAELQKSVGWLVHRFKYMETEGTLVYKLVPNYGEIDADISK